MAMYAVPAVAANGDEWHSVPLALWRRGMILTAEVLLRVAGNPVGYADIIRCVRLRHREIYRFNVGRSRWERVPDHGGLEFIMSGGNGKGYSMPGYEHL